MIKFLIGKIFGTRNERYLRSLRPNVRKINALEPAMQELTDEQLPEKLAEIREAVQSGERSLDDVLCEVFAIVREASSRIMGMRHYDVQLIGGMVLHAGKIAEMKTGEGKTLVATLAVEICALGLMMKTVGRAGSEAGSSTEKALPISRNICVWSLAKNKPIARLQT